MFPKTFCLKSICMFLASILFASCAPVMRKTYQNDTEIEHLSDCTLALKVVMEKEKQGWKYYKPLDFIYEYELTGTFGEDFASYMVLRDMEANRLSPEQAARHVMPITQRREQQMIRQVDYLASQRNSQEAVTAFMNNILLQCKNDYRVANIVMKKLKAGKGNATGNPSDTSARTTAYGTSGWFSKSLPNGNLMAPVASPNFVPVSKQKLAGLKNLQKSLNAEQFQQAYNEAVRIAAPISGLPREQQLAWVAKEVRERYENQGGVYSTDKKDKYNTPYGLLVLGKASCAGSARATCLVLSVLGIPAEHINPNQWTHQWARVPVGDSFWICDPFGLYVGPEPAPRKHPTL